MIIQKSSEEEEASEKIEKKQISINPDEIPTMKQIIYSNGNIYKGWTLNGVPHGQGTLTYPNGVKHEEEHINGIFHINNQTAF